MKTVPTHILEYEAKYEACMPWYIQVVCWVLIIFPFITWDWIEKISNYFFGETLFYYIFGMLASIASTAFFWWLDLFLINNFHGVKEQNTVHTFGEKYNPERLTMEHSASGIVVTYHFQSLNPARDHGSGVIVEKYNFSDNWKELFESTHVHNGFVYRTTVQGLSLSPNKNTFVSNKDFFEWFKDNIEHGRFARIVACDSHVVENIRKDAPIFRMFDEKYKEVKELETI